MRWPFIIMEKLHFVREGAYIETSNCETAHCNVIACVGLCAN